MDLKNCGGGEKYTKIKVLKKRFQKHFQKSKVRQRNKEKIIFF